MREPTVDEACATIIEYPDQDDFVCWNVQYCMYGGEPTDNSIELASYWSKCKAIVTERSEEG